MQTILNKELQLAMKSGKFKNAKADNRLLGLKPKKGWTIVLEDGETALVERDSNSINDFTIISPDGERTKKNTCNADILGYITK